MQFILNVSMRFSLIRKLNINLIHNFCDAHVFGPFYKFDFLLLRSSADFFVFRFCFVNFDFVSCYVLNMLRHKYNYKSDVDCLVIVVAVMCGIFMYGVSNIEEDL